MSNAITGIRPTNKVTVGNLAGAMDPMVRLQYDFAGEVCAFVADIHGLTDQEGSTVTSARLDTARSWLAAGIDPDRTNLYIQSQIEGPTLALDRILQRHVTISRLGSMPSSKDLINAGQPVNQARFGYPTLMAADIIAQAATHVPVGEDQLAHVELTADIARSFNHQYGAGQDILVVPQRIAMQAIKIRALDGAEKMSKSKPSGAIFLHDSPDVVASKIRKAETATAPDVTPALESLYTLAKVFCASEDQRADLAAIQTAHRVGEHVMGTLKQFLTDVVNGRLSEFQGRYASLSEREVRTVLADGAEEASARAEVVLASARSAMGFVPFR